MLKQDTINKIASLLKLKGEDLTTAIKSDKEEDITIDEKLSVFAEDEIQTLKSNSYKEGKKAGVEMEVDEIKKELGLDFQGKTVKGLTEAFKKKVLDDAKIEPAEKVKELETKLSTVQNSYKELETKFAAKEQEVSTTKVRTELYKHIPAFGDNAPALDQDDVIDMMQRKGYEFKNENGKVIAYKDGNKVADKLGNDVEVKSVVNDFLKEKKLIVDSSVPGGRGGSDKRTVGKPGSIKELEEDFKSKNKSTLGEEFTAAVEAARKENPEFKME